MMITAENMQKAKAFELARDYMQAIKTYRTILAKNPVHVPAALRLLVLLRKTKDPEAEVQLLKELVFARQTLLDTAHQNWVSTHRGLAEDTAPLARILGLISTKNRPLSNDETLAKWQARLQALKKRLDTKSAKPNSKNTPKKASNARPEKIGTISTDLAKSRQKSSSGQPKQKLKQSKLSLNTAKSLSNEQVKDIKQHTKTRAGNKKPKPLIKKR